jgi:hypothetical protein
VGAGIAVGGSGEAVSRWHWPACVIQSSRQWGGDRCRWRGAPSACAAAACRAAISRRRISGVDRLADLCASASHAAERAGRVGSRGQGGRGVP